MLSITCSIFYLHKQAGLLLLSSFKLHLKTSIGFENSELLLFYKVFVMGGLLSDGKFILGIIFALWGICSATETPANFVFGDSLVEVGNNNYIVTLSKANYYPNGIDFGKPTGRYTNGRTIIDIIGK